MDITTIIQEASTYLPQPDLDLVQRAYDRTAAALTAGEDGLHHALSVAQSLVQLGLDAPTIAAGLLRNIVDDSDTTVDDLRAEFGAEVARLVGGMTKLTGIDETIGDGGERRSDHDAENLRKMLLAVVDDPRVIVVRLADRLHEMRALKAVDDPERRRRVARETLDIFAPLAGRLGMYQFKWELEDLGFRHVNSQAYVDIAERLSEQRAERERQVDAFIARIREALTDEGFAEFEVVGRPKHIYSIYRKMERKGVPFEQIYDVRAVRIIVQTVPECYHALGVIHSLWRPIPGGFDDYIASPKDNSYQSLHTDVVAEDGKTLEVQIRTQEMHELAELGIAAHWKYKERRRQTDEMFEQRIKWLQSALAGPHDEDAQAFVDLMRDEIFRDQVYVFTPKGKAIELPVGASPIDFAYAIHTEVGHRCRGAKVNGRLVSLNHQLANGDRVEILTTKRGGPSRDWLNPDLGYLRTTRARQKVRQWFRRQAREQNIERGRELVERELRRLSLDQLKLEEVAQLFRKDDNYDEFFAKVGTGDIQPSTIATKLSDAFAKEDDLWLPPASAPARPMLDTNIRVKNVGNLLTNLAHCCNPVPGDPIIGYITRGRGVTIHRKDCPNILRTEERERLIEVDWGMEKKTYPVRVRIRAYDRMRLLRDIGEVLGNEDVGMTSADIITHKDQNLATFTVVMEVTDMSQLSRVLSKLEALPNVLEARRISG
ncbi:MAG: bifunctional (p)ppGpp synthetase/guanosine-3',5'-bis(diphosphate) 3'-pyrophosphohydrolase [Anaerolineae bacterium]|nr:bifunctional (p)ppGpp synthetase/guanosine-3',5'-bis(diphosphate) 3'-pyrophosphohydrolase [Anaerolineae bacterium]